MKKILILSGIGIALICLAGITYYLFVHLPTKQRAELYLMQATADLEKEKLQVQKNEERENKLDECLKQATDHFYNNWQKSCKEFNRKIDEDGSCFLPSDLADSLNEGSRYSREECLKRFN